MGKLAQEPADLIHTARGARQRLTSPMLSAIKSREFCRILSLVGNKLLGMVFRVADPRGSEVSVKGGTVYDGYRQELPDLVCIRNWACRQSSSWSHTQHINASVLLDVHASSPLHVPDVSHHVIRFVACMC